MRRTSASSSSTRRAAPMSKFSEVVDYNWTDKVEFFKSMGAQFTKYCGGGTCKYRGELWSSNQQVRYYVESVDGERVFCVKNYRTGLGACAIQDTDEVVYLRTNDRWLRRDPSPTKYSSKSAIPSLAKGRLNEGAQAVVAGEVNARKQPKGGGRKRVGGRSENGR